MKIKCALYVSATCPLNPLCIGPTVSAEAVLLICMNLMIRLGAVIHDCQNKNYLFHGSKFSVHVRTNFFESPPEELHNVDGEREV